MKRLKLRVLGGLFFFCVVLFIFGIYFLEGVEPVTLSINLWYKLDYICHKFPIPPISHPNGHESRSEGWKHKDLKHLLVLLWFGILAEFCSKHEEDYLTIWLFVEEILSLCQS